MVELKRITVVCIDTKNYSGAVMAIKKTLSKITPYRCVFLTDIDIKVDGTEVIKIDKINSKEDYSNFCIKELYQYFDTEYCLVIQHDSWVLDEDSWDDVFYNYDYIGAPWVYEHGRNIGNGGFSLRSKKLCTILATDPLIEVCHPEDQSIGILYRGYLERTYNIKFPEESVADKFSFELKAPTQSTFGFHSFHHNPYKPTVIIKRTGAMGDVIMTEPVLHYYFLRGYNVVLDTLDPFYLLFQQHYFPIYSKYQIPACLNKLEINLDMAYEEIPKQNHLKSYYEKCGITDGTIRNPILHFPTAKQNKLFNKYVIVHTDEREQPYRNIYGINWEEIALLLQGYGYTVLQVGANTHKKIKGAIEINTNSHWMLLSVVGAADLFIGIDSGISHIASSFNVPSIIFFGSVSPKVIHPDLSNKICIHNHNENGVCAKPFCWHDSITTTGNKCYINEAQPPCTQFKNQQLIKAIETICN